MWPEIMKLDILWQSNVSQMSGVIIIVNIFEHLRLKDFVKGFICIGLFNAHKTRHYYYDFFYFTD